MADRQDGRPADVLLVEDNPGDIRLTEEALKEGKIENTLHVVTDGVEAVEFLYQRGEYADAPRPDMVLLDLNLPRMDGDEVLEEIRQDRELKTIPVIVLTGSKAQEDVVRSYQLCANAYLTKPVDPMSFIEVVQELEHFWLTVVRVPDRDG